MYISHKNLLDGKPSFLGSFPSLNIWKSAVKTRLILVAGVPLSHSSQARYYVFAWQRRQQQPVRGQWAGGGIMMSDTDK